ncbi:radical SAM protein [Chitinophaga sp.]|uniref:radical SAM/SPASM domain-containing protein n=1 Tax=Chitinophaga sp. TaxID=1869181 RepID=UPI0031D5C9D7
MKFSQFNAVIPYSEKFAVYNSFTQRVIFIDPTLKEVLDAAIHEGMDELAKVHPTFHQYLSDQEFLVEDHVNEIHKVKDRVRMVDENIDSFLLTINPSMNCNFKCWYCYETHVKGSRLNNDIIARINTFIFRTANIKGLKNFNLSLFGGEPLLYFEKDVIPVLDQYISQCRQHGLKPVIHFTTNGYLIDQAFVDYFKGKDVVPGFQITLDGYREKHDEVRYVSANKGSYFKIIENIKLLIRNAFPVQIRINYTEKNVDGSHLIVNEFSDIAPSIIQKYLRFNYHRVWQDGKHDNTYLLLEENVRKVEETGVTALTHESPNHVYESCYADKRNSAVINFNGDVFKCTARDFTQVKREGYLDNEGDIVWENNSLQRRMNAKFKNKPCLSCRIMPLCNGGCSQLAIEFMESVDDYCVYSGNENEKMRIVKNKIKEIVGV